MHTPKSIPAPAWRQLGYPTREAALAAVAQEEAGHRHREMQAAAERWAEALGIKPRDLPDLLTYLADVRRRASG